jgi:hypothetical protein
MAEENYRRALEDAIREYEQLTRQRAELDQRIAQLVQTMGSLSRLCNLTPTVALGLTDACRLVLRSAGHPLTAIEVRMQLEAMGWDTSRYANPLASIHIVLKRLRGSGEVKFVPRAYDKPAYGWKGGHLVVPISRTSDLPKMAFWLTSRADRSRKGE